MIIKNCLECQNEFKTRQVDINRGHGKYCSRICSINYRVKHLKPKIDNATCAFCSNTLRISKYRRQQSKSGLFFCSRKCKDKAQCIENNITAIHPSHYQDGKHNYRQMALRNFPNKCNRCSYDKIIDILQVHHKDHNRQNNDLSNLEILCPNCHAVEHWSMIAH